MKRGDRYQRTRPYSDKIDAVELLDRYPDLEYLLRVKDLNTGQTRMINKAILEKKWKKFKGQLQYKLFTLDRVELFKRIYRQK